MGYIDRKLKEAEIRWKGWRKVNVGKQKPSLMKRIYFQTSFFIKIARIKLLRGWDIVKNPKKVISDKMNKKIRRMYK